MGRERRFSGFEEYIEAVRDEYLDVTSPWFTTVQAHQLLLSGNPWGVEQERGARELIQAVRKRGSYSLCPKGFQPRSIALCSIPVTSMSKGRKRVNLEQIPVDSIQPTAW